MVSHKMTAGKTGRETRENERMLTQHTAGNFSLTSTDSKQSAGFLPACINTQADSIWHVTTEEDTKKGRTRRKADKTRRAQRERSPSLSVLLPRVCLLACFSGRVLSLVRSLCVCAVIVSQLTFCPLCCFTVRFPPGSEKEIQLFEKIKQTVPRAIWIQ